MFSRDTKLAVLGGAPVALGELADKALAAKRAGEEFKILAPVYDLAKNVITSAEVEVKHHDKQVAVVTLVGHLGGYCTCARDTEIYIKEDQRQWIKANEVKPGTRSLQPAVAGNDNHNRSVVIATKITALSMPTVPMEVIEVLVKGEHKAFFAGSMMVR